jgi:hypothetical protein
VNVWPAERWAELTTAAGLRVERAEPHVSPGATVAFELLLPAALASRAWRAAFGRRPPHPAPLVRACERVFAPLVRGKSADGSNLLIVARRA